jgi:hypothetical protein
MSAKNYIQLVNDVLVRLRESEVSSVNDTPYSRLISRFVNDAKRNVEDAYNWNALSDTLTATTTPEIFNYVLIGSGQRFRIYDVINDTQDWVLEYRTTEFMNRLFLTESVQRGAPMYYNFNGTNAAGDTQVDLYPIPDAAYNIRFNIALPQPPLSGDADIIKVPDEPVIFLAYAKALAERGEDGGMNSNEAFGLYQQSLADAIALESGRYPEEQTWVEV